MAKVHIFQKAYQHRVKKDNCSNSEPGSYRCKSATEGGYSHSIGDIMVTADN